MPIAQRQAEVTWEGNLVNGHGTLSGATGALQNLPVTWAARTEQPGGKTSPEELIAAAQAACYAMSLANTLAQQGHAPTRLNISSQVTLERNGGTRITTVNINATGQVPGVDEATFMAAAQKAEQGCPVTNALRGNVAINLQAHLQGS